MKRSLVILGLIAMLVAMAAVPALAQTSRVLVTDVSPDGGSASVGMNTNVTVTFNVRMDRSTINSKTFYLKQAGSSAVVPAQVTYARTTKTATLNPDNDLTSGATYTAYVKGGRAGVRGAGGQKLGGTTDSTATFVDARVSWTFTADPPPNTAIDSGPTGTVVSNSASFVFSSTATDVAGFECSLDGELFASCLSPKNYTGLSDGSHAFQVRAKDIAGNVDTSPASHAWTVDTIAPTISNDVSPANTATGVAPSTNVTATFSEAMDEASVEAPGNFALTQQASSSAVPATVNYDPATKKATLDPSTTLDANTTYTATLTVGVKDLAGNALAQQLSWTFTTGIEPPPSITATPSALDFGSAAFCCPTREVVLTHNGTTSVTITPSISGTNVSNFFVPTNPITILPGAPTRLIVTFLPTCPNGTKTGSLNLKDAGGNTAGTVALRGTTINPFC